MTELAVVDTGAPDGQPVVWLGSLGSSTAMWDRQVLAFAGEHRCVLIDHPGHGASPPATGPLSSIAVLGTDVLAALDRSDVARAHVVGLSLGAMVAMWLAAEHPERIDRLALLCTSARFDSPEPWHERAATVRAGGTAAVAETVVGRWLSPAYAADHADEVAAFVRMVTATDAESYAGCCEAIAAMDLHPLLPAIRAATLVVAGTLDPATPPRYLEAIAAAIPGSRLEAVETAHVANWERAGEVNRILAAHLDGSTGG
jgi:3-oxoadipate enol-lactonase